MTNKLPDHPADLIELAAEDLEKCERDPNYYINMARWHFPRGEDRCEVCLAGSVLAQSLGQPLNKPYHPVRDRTGYDLDSTGYDEVDNKMLALEYFRVGSFVNALRAMRYSREGMAQRLSDKLGTPPDYGRSPDEFKTYMRSLAATLREE